MMKAQFVSYTCPTTGEVKAAFIVGVTKKAGKKSSFKLIIVNAPDNYEVENVREGEGAGSFERV